MKVAIVQSSPAYNDLAGSIAKAEKLIGTASHTGAELIVFGESWFCGYPAWLDHYADVGLWDHEPVKAIWTSMYTNGLELGSTELQTLQSLAADHQVVIVFGCNEVVRTGRGNGSLYNALFIIDADGSIKNHHRKLMPTFTEKLVHALGDGQGLQAVDTAAGRIGGLICWEHWMPLARQAMHDSGETLHIALWPYVKEMHQIACRHYAFEGRCFVIAAGQVLPWSAMPPTLQQAEANASDSYALKGGSCVIGPNGQFVLSPQYNIDDILYCELPSTQTALGEKMNLAVSGHYQRWDVFRFDVNRVRP